MTDFRTHKSEPERIHDNLTSLLANTVIAAQGCSLFDACVGPTQEYQDIQSALDDGNCRIGILEDLTLSSAVTLSQDTMIYVSPCANLSVVDGGTFVTNSFNLFLWGSEDNTVTVTYTIPVQVLITGPGTAHVQHLVFDDSGSTTAFNWCVGGESTWEYVELTPGTSGGIFSDSPLTLDHVSTTAGTLELNLGTLSDVNVMDCEATIIRATAVTHSRVHIKRCNVTNEISLIGDNSAGTSTISQSSITNCNLVSAGATTGLQMIPMGTANPIVITQGIISFNSLSSTNSNIIMGVGATVNPPVALADVISTCNSCQIASNNLQDGSIGIEIYEPTLSSITDNSLIDGLTMQTFNGGSYNVIANNNGNGPWLIEGSFADTTMVGNHIDSSCSMVSINAFQRANIVDNFFLSGLSFTIDSSFFGFSQPTRNVMIKNNYVGDSIVGSASLSIVSNRAASGLDILNNTTNLSGIGGITVTLSVGAMTNCKVSGNSLTTSLVLTTATGFTDVSVNSNNVGTSGISITGGTLTQCSVSNNVSDGAMTLAALSASSVSGNTVTATVPASGSIMITGNSATSTVSGNTVTGALTTGTSTTNSNVVTGNRAPGGYAGWTTFAGSGFPNDLLDTGVAPIVAGVGMNRV